jgi:pilus assembly protein Flp/PilA
MIRLIRALWANRSGATAIEYGLIAALIAVATIAGLTSLGTNLNAEDNRIATSIGS